MNPALLGASLLAMAAAGCVASHSSEVQRNPESRALLGYRTVAVADLSVDGWLQDNLRVVRDPAYAHWRAELDASTGHVRDAVRLRLRALYSVQDRPTDRGFEVRAEMTDFDPGEIDPLGQGTSRLAVRVRLVDTDSGEVFGEAEIRGQSRRGVRDAAEQCARGILGFVQRSRSASPPPTAER